MAVYRTKIGMDRIKDFFNKDSKQLDEDVVMNLMEEYTLQEKEAEARIIKRMILLEKKMKERAEKQELGGFDKELHTILSAYIQVLPELAVEKQLDRLTNIKFVTLQEGEENKDLDTIAISFIKNAQGEDVVDMSKLVFDVMWRTSYQAMTNKNLIDYRFLYAGTCKLIANKILRSYVFREQCNKNNLIYNLNGDDRYIEEGMVCELFDILSNGQAVLRYYTHGKNDKFLNLVKKVNVFTRTQDWKEREVNDNLKVHQNYYKAIYLKDVFEKFAPEIDEHFRYTKDVISLCYMADMMDPLMARYDKDLEGFQNTKGYGNFWAQTRDAKEIISGGKEFLNSYIESKRDLLGLEEKQQEIVTENDDEKTACIKLELSGANKTDVYGNYLYNKYYGDNFEEAKMLVGDKSIVIEQPTQIIYATEPILKMRVKRQMEQEGRSENKLCRRYGIVPSRVSRYYNEQIQGPARSAMWKVRDIISNGLIYPYDSREFGPAFDIDGKTVYVYGDNLSKNTQEEQVDLGVLNSAVNNATKDWTEEDEIFMKDIFDSKLRDANREIDRKIIEAKKEEEEARQQGQ